MKKLDIGQTIQILGNLGVVVGIFLLVYELNQNRELMRSQIRNEIATSLSGVLNPTVTDAEFSETVMRLDAGEDLTRAENYRASLYHEQIFRYWENVHYQYRLGLYDESEWSGHRSSITATVNSGSRFACFWSLNREYYSRPFIDFIDSVLPTEGCHAE